MNPYTDLLDTYVDLAPPLSGYLCDEELQAVRGLTDADLTDILDRYPDEAGQVEVPVALLRALLTAQTDGDARLACIALAMDLKRQLKKQLLGRLYDDVCEAIEDEQVNARFMEVL